MRIKKISILIACVLSVTLIAGCGKKTASTNDSSEAEPTKAIDLTKDRYGKYEEPVTLKILSTAQYPVTTTEFDSSNPDRKSPNENMWNTAYKEFLNIDLERQIAEDGTALSATINTSMASGDLPDVIIVDKDTLKVMAENEVLMDLKSIYEDYAGTYGMLISEAIATNPSAIDAGIVDGKLLGFPIMSNCYNSTDILWVRQDWLDKVGKKVPTTMDEMIDVARAFKEQKPGGEETLGLGIDGISGSLIAPYGTCMNVWEKGSNGKYVYGNTTEGMKKGLENLQMIYKEGLIKSDFAVTKILDEEVANGVVGMLYGPGWYSVTGIKSSYVNDEKAEWVPAPIPTLDGNPVKEATNNKTGSFIVVNKDCKHPEAVFKMLELELKMYYEPTKEEAEKYVFCPDGFAAWDLRAFRNFGRADADFVKAEICREGLKNNTPLEEIAPIAYTNYQRALQGLNGDRTQYGFYQTMTQAYPIVEKLLKDGYLVGGYDGPLTESMTLYEKTINEALTNEFLKIVMGDDISNFDKAVSDWYANGGQAITDDINAYYSSLK